MVLWLTFSGDLGDLADVLKIFLANHPRHCLLYANVISSAAVFLCMFHINLSFHVKLKIIIFNMTRLLCDVKPLGKMFSGAPNLLHKLKTLFRLSRELLDL